MSSFREQEDRRQGFLLPPSRAFAGLRDGGATQRCAQAGQQLAHTEGFGQVVVGTGIQGADGPLPDAPRRR